MKIKRLLLIISMLVLLCPAVLASAYDKEYTYYDGEKIVKVQLDTTSAGASVKGTPYGYESRGVEISLTKDDQIRAYGGNIHMGYYWSGTSSESLWGSQINQGITDDVLNKFLSAGNDKDRDFQEKLLKMVSQGIDVKGDWFVAVDKMAHYWVFQYPSAIGTLSNQYVIFNSDEMTNKELDYALSEMNRLSGTITRTVWNEDLGRAVITYVPGVTLISESDYVAAFVQAGGTLGHITPTVNKSTGEVSLNKTAYYKGLHFYEADSEVSELQAGAAEAAGNGKSYNVNQRHVAYSDFKKGNSLTEKLYHTAFEMEESIDEIVRLSTNGAQRSGSWGPSTLQFIDTHYGAGLTATIQATAHVVDVIPYLNCLECAQAGLSVCGCVGKKTYNQPVAVDTTIRNPIKIKGQSEPTYYVWEDGSTKTAEYVYKDETKKGNTHKFPRITDPKVNAVYDSCECEYVTYDAATGAIGKPSASATIYLKYTYTAPKNLTVEVRYYDTDTKTVVGKNMVAGTTGEEVIYGFSSFQSALDEEAKYRNYKIDTTGDFYACWSSKSDILTDLDKAKAATQYKFEKTSENITITEGLLDKKYTAIWIPVKETPGDKNVTVVYYDNTKTDKPVIGTDLVKNCTAGAPVTNKLVNPPAGYSYDSSGTGFAVHGSSEKLTTSHASASKATKYTSVSISSTKWSINDNLSNDEYNVVWIPVKMTTPVTVVYYNTEDKSVVKTEPAADATVGASSYSTKITTTFDEAGESYTYDSSGKGVAYYGKTTKVINTYGKGTAYSASCTSKKFTINDTIVKSNYTALWVPVKSTGAGTDEGGEKVPVKIIYYTKDADGNVTPFDPSPAQDAKVGSTYEAVLDTSVLEGGTYAVDTSGLGYAAHSSDERVYSVYDFGDAYTSTSLTADKFVISDKIVKAKYTAIWVPVKEVTPVNIAVIYYDSKSATHDVIATVDVPAGTVGQKKYSVALDAKDACGENYGVDTAGTAYAAHGSNKNVITTYNKGTKYSSITFSEKKFVIRSALVEADYTAIWIPVKTGVKVTVKYVDEGGTVLTTDDGGVTEKDEPYGYTADPSLPGSEYTIKPEEAYLKNGGSTAMTDNVGNAITVDLFPYDSDTDLIIPCERDAAPAPGGSYSWNYMDTQATSAGQCIIKSDDYDVQAAIPSTEDEYGQVTAAKYLTKGSMSQHTGTRTYTVTVKQTAYVYWWDYDIYYDIYEYEEDGVTVKTDEYGNPVHATNEWGGWQYRRGDDYQVWDSTTLSTDVTLTLPYTWYSLDDYALYKLAYATLTNGSVDSQFVVTPGITDNISVSANVSTAESDHVKDPAGYTGSGMTIWMPSSISNSSAGYSKPSWPSMSASAAQARAASVLGEVQVRNDEFILNGRTVMSGAWKTNSTISAPNMGNIVKSGTVTEKSSSQTIPATRKNITYNSTGQLSYQLVDRLNMSAVDPYTAAVPVNSVNVHTPIVCDVTVESDNLQYVQAVSVDTSKYQLVVGRSDSLGVSNTATNDPNMTNDFTVQFSNTGAHRSITGYGTRNYSKYLLQSGGKSGNMVRFGFDCIVDVGSDYNESNDELITAYSWYQFPTGTTKLRFYLPEWVAEGDYDMEYKSVALNGSESSLANADANLSPSAYAATTEESAQVTPKMYNFTVFDISSTAEWSDVFKLGTTLKYNNMSKYADGTKNGTFDKDKAYYYTAGTKNELGIATGRLAKYALPTIAGSNPKYKNMGVLKAGYVWRFKLDTVSTAMMNDAASIKIIPSFYWVDENGQNREQVDLYYNESWGGKKHSVVRIGGSTDASNVKTDYAGNAEWGINPDELKATAAIRGMNLNTWSATKATVYSYGALSSNILFKTFSNGAYATKISNLGLSGSKTGTELTKLKQSWYFEYSLPEFHAVSKGYDVDAYIRSKGTLNYKESFWKKNGYVIVHIDIEAYDKNGNKIMTYAAPNNNMWTTEGFDTSRTDANSKAFTFKTGDVFMVYADPAKMLSSDYSGDHLN